MAETTLVGIISINYPIEFLISTYISNIQVQDILTLRPAAIELLVTI
jgi:hypothetical protein